MPDAAGSDAVVTGFLRRLGKDETTNRRKWAN
jgi:hypothetical protein